MPVLDGALIMNDGSEFKDYASSYTLDEAAASPLLSNAKKIAALAISEKTRVHSLREIVKSGKANKNSIGKVVDELTARTLQPKPKVKCTYIPYI